MANKLNTMGISTAEWRLRNYLDKHNIYKENANMQTIIINSFYNEHNEKKRRIFSNDDDWNKKLKYVQEHFGLFAQYAQNNWKHNEPKTVL